MSRRMQVGLVGAGLTLTLMAVAISPQRSDPAVLAADLAVGLSVTLAGTFVAQRRSRGRIGVLLAATGLAWLLGGVIPAALYLHRGVLAYLLLAYPTGRLPNRSSAIVVGAACVLAIALPWVPSPSAELGTLALAVVLPLVVAWNAIRASGPVRRARATAAAGAAVIGLVLVAGILGRLADVPIDRPIVFAYDVAVATIGLGLAAELLWGRWSQAAVTGLVLDLGSSEHESSSLRDRLARAIGDPTLTVGYWLAESASYVDDAGIPIDVPGPNAGRRVLAIEDDTGRIGVLVHDELLVDDPALIPSVAAAARLALRNARIHAEIRSRVVEVAASRRRIIEAADSLRRRFEQDVDARVGARLDRIERLIAGVRARAPDVPTAALDGAAAEIRAARAEVRDLVREAYPGTLRDGGLENALRDLASRMPVLVSVAAAHDRYAPVVEATMYFVCSEGLVNAAKHARASAVTVHLTREAGDLQLVIADDGVGGADLRAGAGLRGLADRVEALGGRLDVDSRPGHGTRVVATLPLHDAGLGVQVGVQPATP